MKITRRQLKKLIQEAMSKEEMIGKLDKLAGSSDEGMMQAASLADALPRPETLDIDSSYEYRRKMINKLVTKRRNLAANLKDLSSDAGGMMSPVFQRAESYHDYRSHGQQYPDAHAFKMAEQDIQQEKAEVEDRIAKLDAQIQTLIDTLGMDPATAHISSLSETLEEKKKRKNNKKNKKKSKKRNRLYPYVYGTHYDSLDHVEFGDYGVDGSSFDGGGDGGGGE